MSYVRLIVTGDYSTSDIKYIPDNVWEQGITTEF